MTSFPPPHDGRGAEEGPDGPPAGVPPRKLRLIPVRQVLGDLPARLSFGRVRRFAPAWALRFFPQWPAELVRGWWTAVAAGICAATLVVTLARAAAPRAHAMDHAAETWTVAPSRRPLRVVLGAADWLDVVPLSLAGAIAFAAFCWRERRDRLAVAVTLVAVVVVASYALFQLLIGSMYAGAQARASLTWTPGVRALVSSVLAGSAAGLAVTACAAALWLLDRRRGTRLA